eukprot:CAMPEP_0197518232 /NCGR_PEP_ID=MMETSP1318-20131121/3376_1 /TAXON_ID=552666 /ORGANISM="Partenskyella glossopodia, Strain RCC365" /LENGTH=223 /DNA_ID=CAMNT_0043068401 /DNA_START=51 /DNA_END=722 /DNA_ORIENTATION=+
MKRTKHKPNNPNKIVYALGGISGSGKTFLRTNHPRLRDLPACDIADAYVGAEDEAKRTHRPKYEIAFDRFLLDIENTIEKHHDPPEIVIEAACTRRQRGMLGPFFRKLGYKIRYITVYATKAECLSRLTGDVGKDDKLDPTRSKARIEWVRSTPKWAQQFRKVEGEDWREILGPMTKSTTGGTTHVSKVFKQKKKQKKGKGLLKKRKMLMKDSAAPSEKPKNF